MYEVTVCPICNGVRLTYFLKARDNQLTHETFTLLRCDDCGLAITTPRPDPERLMDYYQSDDYVSHAQKSHNVISGVYMLARRYTLRRKLRLVHRFVPKGAILDFGCGTGEFLKHARHNSWKTYGVEPSARAREAALQGSDNIYPDIDSLPAKDLHAITLWHVLEHIPDINETLALLKSRLCEAGTIFIAVPNVKSYDSLHYREDWAGLDVPRHLWHFSQDNMRKLLGNHGLTWMETLPMGLDSYYVSLLSEKYRLNNSLSIPAIWRALRTGLRSNLAARRSTEYSSLIYVARK